MRILVTIIFLSTSLLLKAQSEYFSTQVENVVYSIDYATSKDKVLVFIIKNNIVIQSQREGKADFNIKFVLNQKLYASYDSLVNTLGYSSSKKVNSVSNYAKISEINLELTYLKQKRDSYVELIKTVDEKSDKYITLWNEQKSIEEKIFTKERELLTLNIKENTYTVSLDLNDETTSPESTGVSFVNMPGFEFSFLNIESPDAGISASSYQGYFLKYLFTKGKSFATVGVYKANGNGRTDSTAISEMFVLGFGQDFYSRHLGRGSRKFFNLYSGYTIGGIMASAKDNKKSNILFVSPSIGLELFKNKYLLIDTKVNYFIPFTNNHNLRGLSYNTSINFVF